MNDLCYQPWLHRFAVLTACSALLPIGAGALVTTQDAGMAFADWPNSDGHNLLLYPWLASSGDKFIEHGHRLAGALIGLVTIGLTALAWSREKRTWVKWTVSAVLAAVILQGLLGGQRVLLDDPRFALAHGVFAAGVFCLMAAVALITGRSWLQANAGNLRIRTTGLLKPLAVVTPLVICLQYFLGSMVRHLGTALHEHLGTAAVVLVFVVLNATAAHRSGVAWLRRPAWLLLGLVGVQGFLGAAAWATRFGWATAGYVGGQHVLLRIVTQTTHTVVGMLVLATSVIYLLRVWRLATVSRRREVHVAGTDAATTTLSLRGGIG